MSGIIKQDILTKAWESSAWNHEIRQTVVAEPLSFLFILTDISGKIEKIIAKMQETLDRRDKEQRTFLEHVFETREDRKAAEMAYNTYRNLYLMFSEH